MVGPSGARAATEWAGGDTRSVKNLICCFDFWGIGFVFDLFEFPRLYFQIVFGLSWFPRLYFRCFVLGGPFLL